MRYNVILCDPPWTYRDKCNAGERGAAHKYVEMSTKDIIALPVVDIAADNCALFIWATPPTLPSDSRREPLKAGPVFEIINRWGFTYKTIAFVWIKVGKNGKPRMCMGHYSRSNAEICMIGIRGKMKRISASVSSVIHAPIHKHSEKPTETRDRIVELFGDVPRIELFATTQAPGWDALGYEIDGRDIRESLVGVINR